MQKKITWIKVDENGLSATHLHSPVQHDYQAGGTGYGNDAYTSPEYYEHLEIFNESFVKISNEEKLIKLLNWYTYHCLSNPCTFEGFNDYLDDPEFVTIWCRPLPEGLHSAPPDTFLNNSEIIYKKS